MLIKHHPRCSVKPSDYLLTQKQTNKQKRKRQFLLHPPDFLCERKGAYPHIIYSIEDFVYVKNLFRCILPSLMTSECIWSALHLFLIDTCLCTLITVVSIHFCAALWIRYHLCLVKQPAIPSKTFLGWRHTVLAVHLHVCTTLMLAEILHLARVKRLLNVIIMYFRQKTDEYLNYGQRFHLPAHSTAFHFARFRVNAASLWSAFV